MITEKNLLEINKHELTNKILMRVFSSDLRDRFVEFHEKLRIDNSVERIPVARQGQISRERIDFDDQVITWFAEQFL